MKDNSLKEVIKHFQKIEDNWSIFSELYSKEINNEFDKTNLKLNFINMIIKTIFGGNKSELLGVIGKVDNLKSNKLLNLEACIYEEDNSIALITNLCWLGGVESKIPTLGISKESNDCIDILSYFMILTNITELKIGYVCYKENDKEENTFKKFGFIETDLKTDDDCYILLKEPNNTNISWLKKKGNNYANN